MKFFKFLAIAFPAYICVSFLASFLLNNFDTQLPGIVRTVSEVLSMSVILVTLLFTPLLKGLGMYVTAYWSLPTTGGIILSALIWEIVFVSFFLIIRKRHASLYEKKF